ncbi:dienelactone hydrolase family protein [Streptomyces sp. NL15-2K]|uniref:dienelactone hydrolase family protein n=1 Tax=Streptomyces sp. NL15-2K TaxID=376149 RepID=UPI000F56896E|nr:MULTISPECIES: dienelactone hydrolase family protein [Actinomycetes]WKX13303.1 dienelactone hydrolase family protein [Kutzneria buriramensis]GCB45334.1 dienelactone hydrolase family [Streptomyces sp. NL15-2K]
MTVIRKQVEAEDGKFEAYLAATETGRGPGVVMVSSIFGIDQDLTNMLDDLANRDCVALAPNFFWRDQDSGVLALPETQRAIDRAMRNDFTKTLSDLRRGIAEVRSHPNCNGKIAVFGFCFGGPFAWRAACDGLGIDAAVSFHGTYVSKAMRPGDQPKCPVSFHYGDKDDFAPPEELETVQKAADATGSEFVIHPGAGHAFTMPLNPHHYHAEASRKSWDRALQMLDALRT